MSWDGWMRSMPARGSFRMPESRFRSSLILIFLINRAYFGWTIAMHWPWGALAQGALLILAVSALASLYPALRASGVPATELTRENL